MDAGVVLDLAIHELDVISYLDHTPIQRVYAETRCQLSDQREDMLTGLLKFESGAIGMLDINWLTPTKIRTLSVTGERGMFVVDYLLQDLVLYENVKSSTDSWGILEILGVGEGNVVKYSIPKMEPLKRELEAFARAVRKRESPQVTGEDGVRALQLALALIESAQTGEAIGDLALSSRSALLGV
jgi:predicted dehydrogenase